MQELIYTIDKIRSERDPALVIHIQVAERSNFILTPLANQPPLTQERLNALAGPKDQSLISFIINEENCYQKKHTGLALIKSSQLNFAHISPKETLQALKLFAMNGKLFFNNKALAIDLYSKSELFYAANPNNKQRVSAFIKSGSQELELISCDFLGKGPPRFFIRGSSLKILSTEISWNDFKNAFDGICRPVHEHVEEAKEDPDAPRVVLEDLSAVNTNSEPLPVLMLKDRLGSFADLEMDYGLAKTLPYHGSPLAVTDRSIKRQAHIETAWEKDLLETDFIKKNVGTSHYYCPLDKVAKSIAFLLEIGWKVMDWRGNRVLMQNDMNLQSASIADHIVVKGKIRYGEFEADLSAIAGAFNRRESFAEIAPGHVALLPASWEQNGIDTLIEECEIVSDGLRIKKNRIGSLASLFEAQPEIKLDQEVQKLSERIHSFGGLEAQEPGPGFRGILRPYQQEGLNWLSFLHDFGFNGILADDMGLGKTVQVIAFLSRLKIESPVLIIVPTTLIFNWQKELEKFLPDVKVITHHGSKRTNKSDELDKPAVIITTYATLRLDGPFLSQLNYTALFLDEAQAIKNSQSLTAQSAARLKADFRLSITGTPIENHIMELWSHFNFLMPDLLGEEKSFASEVQAGVSDSRFHKRIKRMVRPFLLRRLKEDVAKDLPEKIEQVVWVEMGESQRKAYESFLSGTRNHLLTKVSTDGISKHRMEILEAIMRLRQICCHPLLLNQEDAESAKLDVLMQDLETVIDEGRKVLVYSQFTSMLSLISAQVKEKGWGYVYLDGATQNREKVVAEFQDNSRINVFLISLKAGGVGLNLTAADYVFLYDPWWNNAVENQAIDRAHRIGRKDTVIAKRYITTESIEEKMMKLKAAKSALATDLLDDNAVLSTLSADDLLFLLS